MTFCLCFLAAAMWALFLSWTCTEESLENYLHPPLCWLFHSSHSHSLSYCWNALKHLSLSSFFSSWLLKLIQISQAVFHFLFLVTKVSKALGWLGKVSPSLEHLALATAASCLSCVSKKYAYVIKGQLQYYHIK